MQLRFVIGVVVLAINSGTFLPASTIYDEAVQGDLSNSGLSPTPIIGSAGSNQILGTTGRDANGIDRYYFTITVPLGLQLSSLVELAGTTVGGAVSFLGMQAGDQVTVPTNATDATGLLGWAHYGETTTDIDLLPAMSIPSQGSSGFTHPLSAGDYSFWIQDFNTGRFSYGFDLMLTPVASSAPEPRSYASVLAGLIVFACLCKRRKRFFTNLLESPSNCAPHHVTTSM